MAAQWRDCPTEEDCMSADNLGASTSFASVATRYDETRDIPEAQLAACYDRLRRSEMLPLRGRILDAGCGTGQISLPLAKLGYEIRGYDLSPEMAALAQAKCPAELRAIYRAGDVRVLPEEDASVDSVVVSKLLMHVQDWQVACGELLRVLRPGGCVINIAERGAFGNSVRVHFAGCADALGLKNRFLGVTDRNELAAFMRGQGCIEHGAELGDLAWTKRIVYDEVLRQFEERHFAEFWYLPLDAYARILNETAAWVDAQPDGRSTVETMRPYLSADIFRKPPA
jgi:ubiquinone/menaquinone biosynthesis C-methylase UbiE